MTGQAEVIAETDEPIEQARQLPAVIAHEAMVARAEVSVADVVAQRDKIMQVQEAVMREGVHYGKIPGISKPSLFKPGAEVLCTTFRFGASYQREIIWHDNGHLTVISDCTLTHAPSGIVLGSGGGMCSSRESKYAYRKADKVCLACGAPLRRSKQRGSKPPEWYCWAKQGGCGATFAIDDPSIEAQAAGRLDNPDLADTFNTVLKMGDKRALVAAILVCTAASDLFTQDVEDNTSTAVAEAAPANGRAAAGSALEKMRLDIQDLWRQLDKKRKTGAGATYAESQAVLGRWYGDELAFESLDEEQLIRLGTSLGGYWAYWQQKKMPDQPHTFVQFAESEDVPF